MVAMRNMKQIETANGWASDQDVAKVLFSHLNGTALVQSYPDFELLASEISKIKVLAAEDVAAVGVKIEQSATDAIRILSDHVAKAPEFALEKIDDYISAMGSIEKDLLQHVETTEGILKQVQDMAKTCKTAPEDLFTLFKDRLSTS